MLSIYVNENLIIIDENISLATILEQHGFTNSHCAIAINRTFIPKIHHHILLKEGDRIEIVSPMQGG